jgi:hypothetical protein
MKHKRKRPKARRAGAANGQFRPERRQAQNKAACRLLAEVTDHNGCFLSLR